MHHAMQSFFLHPPRIRADVLVIPICSHHSRSHLYSFACRWGQRVLAASGCSTGAPALLTAPCNAKCSYSCAPSRRHWNAFMLLRLGVAAVSIDLSRFSAGSFGFRFLASSGIHLDAYKINARNRIDLYLWQEPTPKPYALNSENPEPQRRSTLSSRTAPKFQGGSEWTSSMRWGEEERKTVYRYVYIYINICIYTYYTIYFIYTHISYITIYNM